MGGITRKNAGKMFVLGSVFDFDCWDRRIIVLIIKIMIPITNEAIVINAVVDDIKLLFVVIAIFAPSNETAPKANTSSNQPKLSFSYSTVWVNMVFVSIILSIINAPQRKLKIANAGCVSNCLCNDITGKKKLTGPKKTINDIGKEINGEKTEELVNGLFISFLISFVLKSQTISCLVKNTVKTI